MLVIKMTVQLNQIQKPKTRKGKLVLAKREAQLVEGAKEAILVRGATGSDLVTKLMRDLVSIKKPHSVFMSKKNDLRPFEDGTKVEFLCLKNQAPLFGFSSHNKKRPHNLLLGRTFDGYILDMAEFAIENYKGLSEFKTPKVGVGSKPVILFSGEAFETQFDYGRVKNLLLDFFTGPKADNVRLNGLENVITLVAQEGKIHFRHYRIMLKKSGTKVPRVELEEIGPRFDMKMGRNNFASEEHFKQTLKHSKEAKHKKVKNIVKSGLGTTFAKVHMERQDYGKLGTRGFKGTRNRQQSDAQLQAAFDKQYGKVQTPGEGEPMDAQETQHQQEVSGEGQDSASKRSNLKRNASGGRQSKKVRFNNE